MSTILLFPGQGSQIPGMALDIIRDFPEVEPIYRQCFALNPELEKVLSTESMDIHNTRHAQPALGLFQLAILQILKNRGVEISGALGQSAGEFPAFASIGLWTIEQIQIILSKRAQVMSDRLQLRKQEFRHDTMLAVIGLDLQQVEAIIAFYDEIWVTNINSASQIVIGGCKAQLNEARDALHNAGAYKTVYLEVEGAFHSPYFQDDVSTFHEVLLKQSMSTPTSKMFLNHCGYSVMEAWEEPQCRALIPNWMSQQMATTINVYAAGQSLFKGTNPKQVLEIGPTSVLLRNFSKELKGIEKKNISHSQDVKEFLSTAVLSQS